MEQLDAYKQRLKSAQESGLLSIEDMKQFPSGILMSEMIVDTLEHEGVSLDLLIILPNTQFMAICNAVRLAMYQGYAQAVVDRREGLWE